MTNSITVPFTFEGAAKDPFGNLRIGFEGSVTINRKDYGITWNAALETGGVLVSDKVTPGVRDLRDQERLTADAVPSSTTRRRHCGLPDHHHHSREGSEMTNATLTPQVDVRRAEERFKTRLGWLDSKHSFSFSRHYDPANTHHGLLLVNNDDIVKPGTGFETHPHQDMEIVTWVLQGSLVHQDSEGHTGVIYPGLAQRMSAGTGILHSEKNDSWRLAGEAHTDPVHFVQMWVVPDESGITPGYEQLEIDHELLSGGWRPSPPACPGTKARRPSGSGTATPPCTPPGCSPARASSYPKPPSCTFSCPAGASTWKAPGSSRPETRYVSPPPADSRSPRWSRPRSSSGKCTPPSAEPPAAAARGQLDSCRAVMGGALTADVGAVGADDLPDRFGHRPSADLSQPP